MNTKKCPICRAGKLEDMIDWNFIDKIEIDIPVFFSKCDVCDSEQADSFQVALNKEVYKQLLEREKHYDNLHQSSSN